MGYDWKPSEYNLPMAVNYERKSSDRLGLIPVFINKEMEVVPVDFHGSAHLAALSGSDGLVALEPGKKSLIKGEIVNVRQI
jgi:molybdopterin molybdotransferase